jgi:hypothetical protein
VITGNKYGYYGACKDCQSKLNDMCRCGPKSILNNGKNRFHGQKLHPSEKLEDFPQDARCYACGMEGCHPINCTVWQRFNINGLDRVLGKPPKPSKSASKTPSEKSSVTSSKRGEKRDSHSANSPRIKSPRTSDGTDTPVVETPKNRPRPASEGAKAQQSYPVPQGQPESGTPSEPVRVGVDSQVTVDYGRAKPEEFVIHGGAKSGTAAHSRNTSQHSSIPYCEASEPKWSADQAIIMEAKVNELRMEGERAEVREREQGEEIQRLTNVMERTLAGEAQRNAELEKAKEEARDAKESLSANASLCETQKERIKFSEKEIIRLRQQIADDEASHQLVIEEVNRDSEAMQRKIRSIEPSIREAESTAATVASAAAAVRYDGEIKEAKGRLREMESALERQEKLREENEGRIRRECEAQVRQANARLTEEMDDAKVLTDRCEEMKKRVEAAESGKGPDSGWHEKAWREEVDKANNRAAKAEQKIESGKQGRKDIEDQVARVLKLLEGREEEIRRLKEEAKQKRPDAFIQELMEAQRVAEEESRRSRIEAAEQTAQIQEERRCRDRLQREVERLEAGTADKDEISKMNAMLRDLKQQLEDCFRSKEELKADFRARDAAAEAAAAAASAEASQRSETIRQLRDALRGEERLSEYNKSMGKRLCE